MSCAYWQPTTAQTNGHCRHVFSPHEGQLRPFLCLCSCHSPEHDETLDTSSESQDLIRR